MATKKRAKAKKSKKAFSLGDIFFRIVHEGFDALFENVRSKSFEAFPVLMKSMVHKLLKRYIYMMILGFVGLLLVGIGIAEYLVLSEVPKYLAYIAVGFLFGLIGVWQFKKE